MSGTIYRNERQARKLQLLLWGLAGFALVGISIGLSLLPSYGIGLAIFLWTIAVAPVVGMLFYASIYALEIRNAGPHLAIDVMTLTGRQTIRIKPADIHISEKNRGRMISAHGQYIDTPWVNLSVKGRRLPFILDLQAEDIDEEALARLGSN